MRILVALLLNLLLLIKALLALPFRLLRRRQGPYVRFALRGDPPYRELARRRWRIFAKRDPAEVRSLDELRRQLLALSKDARVRGAVFFVEHLQMTQAKADAIAALFAELRAAGKEVIGYALHAGNAEYEVLCAADRIILAPPGRLDLTGFAAEATAIKTALDRAGIGAQFVRRGEYKTAPELFTDAQISEIHRQTVEHLLDLRFQDLLLRISRGRRIGLEEAKRKVDRGPYSAKRAQAEGLCDALCSAPDLASFLSPAAGKGAAEKRAADESSESSEDELPDW
ncbi:MAG TPA: S49 family peptidase, partial [Myxococcaceae bacterium]|nr:S49 family peptidase [Myxococcaceae bacterium]